jgi:hypothetical protein
VLAASVGVAPGTGGTTAGPTGPEGAGAGGLTCALATEANTKIQPLATTANARRTSDSPE